MSLERYEYMKKMIKVKAILLAMIMVLGSIPFYYANAEEESNDGGKIEDEEIVLSSSNEEYSSIEELLKNDDSISFDPSTQTFVVVEIKASKADNVSRLIKKGLLTEEAMNTAMDWKYYMNVSINNEDVTSTKDFYIYDGNALNKGTVGRRTEFSTLGMQMVSSNKGKNIIILNKGETCKVEPIRNALFWGTDGTSTNPIETKSYECYPSFAAPNPIENEDLTGRECTSVQSTTTLTFSYEWNMYNWIELETWYINDEEKNIDFATKNIPKNVKSDVDYLFELRDEEGNIFPLPVTIYDDYGDGTCKMMTQPGIVHQYAERDNNDCWTEGGARVPAGYDFRIRALNNDQPIGVYIGGSDQIKNVGWDNDGFREVANSLDIGQFIVEEYFVIPTEEIRIEKIATNATADEDYVFSVSKNYPYYNWKTQIKTDTVQMELINYPYTVYSSADNTKIGEYKTTSDGTFTLKNGQYAIFKVWKNTDDFVNYEDNGSTYWKGYKLGETDGHPLPDSSTYSFKEQTLPNCVTTIEHITTEGTNTVNGTDIDNVHNGDSIVFHNTYETLPTETGTLTISKTVSGTGTPDKDTSYEFVVTKDGNPAVGQYCVGNGEVQEIPSDGKIIMKAGESAVLSDLEVGEYTVSEIKPTQSNYKSTSFSVNGASTQTGLSATVNVTASKVKTNGGWATENDVLVQDDDGYFTYTLTADQIDADGNITVDCDLLAEYMEAYMRAYQNIDTTNFKVKFVNETGTSICYQDYEFDTVNWIPVGETYTTSDNLTMKNTNENSSDTSAGYGWGDAWQHIYSFMMGETDSSGSFDVKGFDGNNVRLAIAPLRCINPAIVSYFNSNPGENTLTGNSSTDSAQKITLLQMNAFPELIKEEFTFKNWKGEEITMPADSNRTYSDFICAFYEVDSLDDLTIAQKYNVLGTGYKGSLAMPYAGQSAITTYYSNLSGSMSNWCVPYEALNDGTLDYFKTCGFSKTRIEAGKKLISGGQEFSNDDAATYAYQQDYYLLESDPEILKMAYDYLYSRCIRFSFDTDNRAISTSIDNSATSNDSVGGIKEYMDKTEEATANVLVAMNNGEKIADGESITLDRVSGYIEVPNAWNQFRMYDFGFKLIFKTEARQSETARVEFTNVYEESSVPTPTPTATTTPTPTVTPTPTTTPTATPTVTPVPTTPAVPSKQNKTTNKKEEYNLVQTSVNGEVTDEFIR